MGVWTLGEKKKNASEYLCGKFGRYVWTPLHLLYISASQCLFVSQSIYMYPSGSVYTTFEPLNLSARPITWSSAYIQVIGRLYTVQFRLQWSLFGIRDWLHIMGGILWWYTLLGWVGLIVLPALPTLIDLYRIVRIVCNIGAQQIVYRSASNQL